jgi:hypothetical protein
MPDPAAAPPFGGFAPAAFAWFAGLEADNSRQSPRGFPRDHPRAALLRHKSLIAGRRLVPSAAGAITAEAASDHARSTWSAIAPMNAWLDAHVGATAHPAHP